MMVKTTLREIKQSLGRYLAILAIVALGVGFFSGLKVTMDSMVVSADNYLSEAQLFDYRLLSTLGFEEEDVEALAAKDGVRAVEGALSVDIIFINEQGNESVIKAHSLSEKINKVVLTAGRLPESGDECVVDGNLYGESAIGSKVILAESNSEEDLDHFTYREYTITGIVQAPYYIQFERGNTSLGNGRVSGFMYLLPEGFQMDYYTEIFVKFDTDYLIYSKEYESFIEEKKAVWESYCEEQGQRRYDAVLKEANEELADAETELADKKEEAETELLDARKELEEAEEKIADGEAELADGEEQLADSRKQLADGRKQLADGEKQIEEAEAELAEREAELAAAGEKIAESEAALEAMRQEYGAYAQVPQIAAQLAAAEQELLQAKQQFAMGEAALVAAREEIETAKKELADNRRELAEAEKEIAEAEEELADARQELLDAKEELADGWQEYNDAYEEFETEIADAEEKLADARAEIEDIKTPDTYVLGRDTNVGYACFENDSSIIDGIANVFPVFFFLVAALVCMTTMNRMVEEQRTQIGVLKALGYSEASIMGKYLFYSGSAALIGSVAGFFVGTIMLPYVIWVVYKIMYRLGSFYYVFDAKLALISLIVAICCTMGTTWFSCRQEFKEVAASLMRPKAPKAGKRVFLERVSLVWKRLNFLQKVSVRNVFRYKKRFFMMIIGISGCTALLVTGFGIKDSIKNIARKQYEEIHVYDLSISLQEDYRADKEKEAIRVIEEYGLTYLPAYETTLDLEIAGQIKSVNLVVIQEPENLDGFISLHTGSGKPIEYPKAGEAVIANQIADNYKVGIGDEIWLYDEDRNAIRVTISGICENFVYNYIYIAPETYEEQIGVPDYKTLYANVPEEADLHQTAAAVMQAENISTVSVNEDFKERFTSMMGNLDYVVVVIILCAAALAFIVLYNLNNINITERLREIATIKVLGFYQRETAQYVFRENTVLAGIGCVVGLFLGKLLHAFVMQEAKIDMVSFDVHIQWTSYFYSIILTFVFAWLVNRMMTGKLNRINMAESLKSVD
ncbi:MAG: FtsX-like permease family protein [Lachnospiraceae bacterium]|nr:FtsX-like permease family protein [Lachnospiraceae bacterium]